MLFLVLKMKYKLFWFLLVFSKKKEMKCLLCSSKFKDQKELLDHYLSYHNIDKNNCFFQKLFQSKNKTLLKNCIRCNEFLATEKQKAVPDFLKHYDEAKNILFEEKLLDIVKYPGLMVYYIDFKKYSSFYNFYNSEKCVDDFLRNLKPTETYDCIYFNDFIFYALRQDILKRVIINTMSSSSWLFKRFVHLAVKILHGEVEISI